MITYDQFLSEWNNKQVTKFGGECVALVAEYEAENNLPIVWGDAASWVNNPILTSVYDWVQNNPNDPNQLPPRGSPIVWGSDLPYTNGAGHIAFFDRPIDAHNFMSFGQNSGGPTAHFQQHSWAHVAGWYVLKQQPAPVAASFSVVPFSGQFTVSGNKWNLDQPNLDAIAANPVAGADSVVHTFVAQLNRSDLPQYTYYLEDANVHQGYNSMDCHPYTPPAPEPAPTYQPPSAPLPVPTDTTPYMILADIPYYGSASDAQSRTNPKGTLKAESSFYRYKSLGGMDSLTDTPGTSQSIWINPSDNKTPVKVQEVPSTWTDPRADTSVPITVVTQPAPAPVVVAQPKPVEPVIDQAALVKQSYRRFFPKTDEPVEYKILKDIVVQDQLYTHRSIPIRAGRTILIFGWFVKDGKTYLRPLPPSDEQTQATWYGIQTIDPNTGAPYLLNEYSYQDRIKYGLEAAYDRLVRTIEGIFKPRVNK